MATLIGDNNSNVLDGTIVGDLIKGLGGNDTLDGKGGVDTLVGGTGADKVFGGAGRDFLVVGDGDTASGEIYDGGTFDNTDTLIISGTSSAIVGEFFVDFSASQILTIEALDMSTAAAATAQFASASFGGSGLSFALNLLGGAGKQTVSIEMLNDTAINLSGLTFSNWDPFSDEIRINGDADAESITGSAQRDIVNAGAGIDTVALGGGDDVVIINATEAGDSYSGGTGIDYLKSTAASVDLRAATLSGFDVLVLDGPGNQNVFFNSTQFGSGLALDSTLNCQGGSSNTVTIDVTSASFSANSFFFGGFDADDRLVLNGDDQGDTITGSQVNDTINGNLGSDVLIGGAGDDELNGGSGDDFMFGGSGNDSYFVDSAGDIAAEVLVGADPGGVDRVVSTVNHTLSGFIENLVLKGGGAIQGFGNGLDNEITGSDIGNTLRGLGGNDRLVGGGGVDVLIGGAGNDTYVFRFASESSAGAANRDTINGLRSGEDVIDVSGVDADFTISGNQAFVLDAGGTFDAGEFRFRVVGGNTIIDFNTDADSTAEMQIVVSNVTGMTAADLIL